MPTPAQVNWARFRVISLTLVALCILIVLFSLLTGGTLLEKKTELYLFVPDSTGIGSGSPVRVDGIDVGQVDRAELSGDTSPDRVVKLSIKVGKQWLADIPSDSSAQLSTDTLIGDKFVDIASGPGRTPIRADGEIRYKEKPDVLQRLDLQQFQKELRAVDAQISDIEHGRGPVGVLFQGTGMYDEWRKLLRETQRGVHAVAAREGTLGSLVYSDKEYQALRGAFANLDQSLARLQSGQGDLGRLLRDDAQYQQLTASLADLKRSIGRVQASPWLQSDTDYRGWSRGLNGILRTADDFNASPLLATSQLYDNLNGLTRELEKNLRDFRINPRKYLRFKVF
jgi:phospholipid/cholesterol/gamma-HCH transport system substrate-binding protein